MINFKIESQTGGRFNLNFLAIYKGKKVFIKFLSFNPNCNRDLQIKVKQILSKKSSLLNIPKCLWVCRNLLVEEFLEDLQQISYKEVLLSPNLRGFFI